MERKMAGQLTVWLRAGLTNARQQFVPGIGDVLAQRAVKQLLLRGAWSNGSS
jgi:hypothetical protein